MAAIAAPDAGHNEEEVSSATSLRAYRRPRFWPIWTLWAWMRLTAALPIPVSLRIHEYLGTLGYWLAPRQRAIAERNIAICFPDLPAAERRRLARRHFAAFAAAVAECAIAWFAPDSKLANRVDVVGREHLVAALAQGKGVILHTGHFTGLEISGRFLKGLVPDFACMFSHRSNALLDEIQRRGRQRCAHESIPNNNVRAMLERLERNAVVWYAPDQVDTSGRGVTIPFFGEPALTSTAASRIARVSGAAILPFGYRRITGTARYELRFHAPLADLPSDDPAADMRRLVAALEEFVRAAPEQYQWTHKRFKARQGVPDPYAPGEAEARRPARDAPVVRTEPQLREAGDEPVAREQHPVSSPPATPDFSVVIPLNNEAANVEPLLQELRAALAGRPLCEIILVDDGSDDGTANEIRRCARDGGPVRLLSHADRRGQSTAIYNGIRAAATELVVVLDGDLQNDPGDIGHFLETLATDPRPDTLGLLIGHRVQRRDSRLRRLSSRIANTVRARILHDATPDTGCGLKLIQRSVFLRLPYFDHMHRFLPALVQRAGFRVVSLPVRHRPRTRGHAHSGVGDRLWVGLVDLAGVAWLARRSRCQEFREETV